VIDAADNSADDRPMVDEPVSVTPPPPPPPPPTSSVPPAKAKLPLFAKLCVLAVVLAVPAGFVHCVYGGGGPTVCAKESWGLSDTFVDADEYIGRPIISLLPKANVVRALVQCGVLSFPDRE
jgi:hypothetical protein